MRRRFLAISMALVALAGLTAGPAVVGGAGSRMLEFGSMTGLPSAFTGVRAPIRGVNGGGLPWVIGSGRGELTTGGWLAVKVRDLVIDPSDATAISRGVAGTNPIASFRALVSCLTADGGTANVLSDPFPVTTGFMGGDGGIETQLALPSPCLAPIVFITSPGGAWFATTGG